MTNIAIILLSLMRRTAFGQSSDLPSNDVMRTIRFSSEACLSNDDCSANTFCKTSPCAYGNNSKICANRVDIGGTCSDEAQCFDTLYCHAGTKKCSDFRHLGETCDKISRCGSGLKCSDTTKKCVEVGMSPKAQLGESCQSTSDCASSLWCLNKKCARRRLTNVLCSADEQCRGYLFCAPNTKKCTRFRQLAETCNLDSAKCETGMFCDWDGKCARPETWDFSKSYKVADQYYYRLGSLPSTANVPIIAGIFDAVVNSIKIQTVKERLAASRPIYLVGKSAREFTEFTWRFTEPWQQYLLDIMAFATNVWIPGFVSSDFEGCAHPYYEDDVPVHEFMHTVHLDGLSDAMKARINFLYNQYNVPNPNYNIDSYAFVDDREFFAEMGQIFTEVTVRQDVTGGLDKAGLKAYLPEMYELLESIFDVSNNKIKAASCAAPCAQIWSRCSAVPVSLSASIQASNGSASTNSTKEPKELGFQ